MQSAPAFTPWLLLLLLLLSLQMSEANAQALLVTALDEVAWLTNLRGSDVDFNPVFLAYAMVTAVRHPTGTALLINCLLWTPQLEAGLNSARTTCVCSTLCR